MAEDRDDHKYSLLARGLAWSVHLFTACGVICCLLALEATYAAQWRTALIWLFVAVIIDAVDGTFARLVRVKKVLPDFDGALLDNLIDYANYVIVPALILHRADLLPASVSFLMAGSICLASAYQFCQADAKTPDHYFTGFPSYWNVTVFYLLVLGFSPMVNLVIVAVLVVSVFVPIKYVYLTRTIEFRAVTLPLTLVWSVMAMTILWQLPEPASMLVWTSLAYVGYYIFLSVYLTLRTAGSKATVPG